MKTLVASKMNTVLRDEFFYGNLFGLLCADMQQFAERAECRISDDLAWVVSQALCAQFCGRRYTFAAVLPSTMHDALPSDPRVSNIASRTILAELRPLLAERLVAITNNRYSQSRVLSLLCT